MQIVRPGDVVLYAVRTRQKDGQAYYYCCEVVGSVSGGQLSNVAGEPVTGVLAIYRRSGTSIGVPSECQRLARDRADPDEKSRLQKELRQIYGPGELIVGFSCEGGCPLSLKTE